MSKYPYKYKTPEEVFSASDKRMEEKQAELKAAIIAHLDVIDPGQLHALYLLVRAATRKEYKFTIRRALTMIIASKKEGLTNETSVTC